MQDVFLRDWAYTSPELMDKATSGRKFTCSDCRKNNRFNEPKHTISKCPYLGRGEGGLLNE